MKIKKIKWLNIIKLFIFAFCIGVISHDVYMLTLHSFITGEFVGWTWFGLITFILFVYLASTILEDFEEQINERKKY